MTHSAHTSPAPNHHAHHRPFSGVSGLLVGLTLTIRRGGVARLATDLTAVTDDDHVVDVGCGPGTAARVAARRGAKVTGIDPASVMLTLARRLTFGGSSIRWMDGSAEALPLPDGSANVLWSIATVHHWRDVDAGLSEAFRVLAPEGRLLAIERHARPGATGHASHGWTDAQAQAFADRCAAAGFTDTRVETHRADRGSLLAVQAKRP